MLDAQKITSLRLALNKTPSELAQVLGVSTLTVRRWEAGVPPTAEDEAKLKTLIEHVERRKGNV